MKIQPGWRFRLLMAVFCSLCLAPLARGQDAVLTITMASESVTAGAPVSVWMNVLNPSGQEISWTFPPQIERKVISAQGSFAGELELHSPELGKATIAPGAFVRREYIGTIPAAAAGQAVLEFPGLNANRVVLEVAAPGSVVSASEKGPDSFVSRYFNNVEPEEPDKDSGPGRFFKEHISGYEPMYFIAGAKSPNARFQISFAYQLLNQNGPLVTKVPALKGFHVAYTQSSLWDWNTASAPFYDTSYQPEFFYAWQNVTCASPTNWFQLDLQGGLRHSSNGKDGDSSRSMNIAYLRPTLTFGRDAGLQLTLQPRVWTYLGNLSGNPDIADYRGYVDLRTIVGWQRGLQLSALGQIGKDGDHGSVQLDLTYPTMRFFGSFSLYLDVQYFTGYGESLLGYNIKSDEFRVGFSLFR